MTAVAGEGIGRLVLRAQGEMEAALRGASLCSVSREPGRGATDVKVCEGRWYTLRDIERDLEAGTDPVAAVAAALERLSSRTPTGPAWVDYRRGAQEAVVLARDSLGLSDQSRGDDASGGAASVV